MKLIIFDFDGVLINTLIACYEISAEVNEGLSMDEYKSFSIGNIFKAIHKKRNPNFDKLYKEKTRELAIPEEMKKIIRKNAEKYPLSIVSSTPGFLIKEILKREGVEECFKDVLGSDVDTDKVKKNKMLLEKHGIDPEEAIYVTDTVGDIREAREAGIQAIAVTWGFHDKEMLEKEKPFAVVDTPEELEEKLESNT